MTGRSVQWAIGQYNLGVMYENGRGVAQDYVLAHMWLNLAAAQSSDERDLPAWGLGHEAFAQFRNTVAALMTPEQIAQAQQLAREWKLKTEP